MPQLFTKGLSLSIKLIIVIVISFFLMILDYTANFFSIGRYYLDTLISPTYYISDLSVSLSNSLKNVAKDRQIILNENESLREQLLIERSKVLQIEFLKKENNRLRQLLDSPLQNDEYKKVVQVLVTDTNPYNYQVILNKGTNDKVYVGQPIIDEKGVVGQIFTVATNTSKAILICDYQHALPVQVSRNDLFMVAVGNGCNNDLVLEYLSNEIDVKTGDVLVTSGLDGNFPSGYPVAIVNNVTFDKLSATWNVTATPTADLKRLRYLLLLWNQENLVPSLEIKHE